MKVLLVASFIALVAAAGANAAAVNGQRILKKNKKKKSNKGCMPGASCVSTFKEFKTEIGTDKSSAEINICPGATITFEDDLLVYSDTTIGPLVPFDLQLLCCDCNCILDGAGFFFGFGNTVEPLSAMKLTMSGIKLQSTGAKDGESFIGYLQANSYYQEAAGGCPNSIDLAMTYPFEGYREVKVSTQSGSAVKASAWGH